MYGMRIAAPEPISRFGVTSFKMVNAREEEMCLIPHQVQVQEEARAAPASAKWV